MDIVGKFQKFFGSVIEETIKFCCGLVFPITVVFSVILVLYLKKRETKKVKKKGDREVYSILILNCL